MYSDSIRREIERKEDELKNKDSYIKRYSSNLSDCQKIIDRKLSEIKRTSSESIIRNCQREIENQNKKIVSIQSNLSRYQKDAARIQAELKDLNRKYVEELKKETEQTIKHQKEEQERQQRELQRQKEDADRKMRMMEQEQDRQRREIEQQQRELEKERNRQRHEIERQQSGVENTYNEEPNRSGRRYSLVKCVIVIVIIILALRALGFGLSRVFDKLSSKDNNTVTTEQTVPQNTANSSQDDGDHFNQNNALSSDQADGPVLEVIGHAEVIVDELFIRSSPSTSGYAYGFAKQNAVYDVYSYGENEGYTWYQIGESEWIADDHGKWVIFTRE